MTSLVDLYKYAKTGIPAKGMKPFDKLLASQLAGGFSITTLSGVPPMPFLSDGAALTAWNVIGAAGGVGDKTSNLAPPLLEWTDGYVTATGTVGPMSGTAKEKISDYIDISGMSGKLQFTHETGDFPYIGDGTGNNAKWTGVGFYKDDKTFISRITNTESITIPANAAYCRLSFRTFGQTGNTMLNNGDTALPYVPFGCFITVSCGGVTQTIYLDAPLAAEDSVSMESTGITITPASGSNQFSVGSTVQPSSVSITGNIKATT